MPGRRPLASLAWIALGLVALAALAYGPLPGNEFVNYDDDLLITDEPHVRAGLTREGVVWAFTSFAAANWFPLTRLSWMLDAELFGLDPDAFHATNWLLHTATGLLLFLFLVRATGALAASAFVAAVFAVHPLHVESVAWASSRKDVLSGLFLALALLAYERYARGSRRAYAGVLAALALGLMAKPILVVTPFLLLLLDVWPLGRARRGRLAALVIEKLPLLALVAAASAVTWAAQSSWGTVQALERLPLGPRLANAAVAVVRYVAASFWPSGLAVFHPLASVPAGRALGAAALLAVLTALSLWRRPIAVGWLWFLGALVPVIGLVQVGQAAMADRYAYLPQIGLTLALAFGLAPLARGRARPVLAAAALAAVVALAVTTRAQVRVWRDSTTLFEHALRVTGDNHVAHINLGAVHAAAGRLDAAAEHLLAALRLAPASRRAHGLLAGVRLRQRRPHDAVRHYRLALSEGPGRSRHDELGAGGWHAGLGDAYTAIGRFEAAVASYGEALRRGVEPAPVHRNLARARLEAGDPQGARASAERALALDPDLPEAHGYLGAAWFALGDVERAIAHFERALALDPELPAIHAHLARALARRGDPAAALAHLDEAVRLAPADAGLERLRASALLAAGRSAEAAAALRALLAAGERGVATLNDLAWLLATSEDPALRDPAAALALASEAAVAAPQEPAVLDTLAVAQAASGRPAEAVATAERALALAEAAGADALAEQIRRRLAGYRERRDAAARRPRNTRAR